MHLILMPLAAVRIIGLRGFAHATTQEIAETAGVSEGLIYRYYKTKLDLGLELFKKHYGEVLSLMREESARHKEPLERLRHAAKAYYTWFDANTDVARFVIKTHSEFLDLVDEDQGLINLTSDALKDMFGEGLFSLVPGDILAAMFFGTFFQVSVEALHGQVKGPLAPRMEPIIDALVALIAQAGPRSLGPGSAPHPTESGDEK